MCNFRPNGLGWQRDLPDVRDWTPQHAVVRNMLATLDGEEAVPDRIDWCDYFGGINDQLGLKSSAAHACLGLMGYFERRAHGTMPTPSRMFVYKASRRLLHQRGDTGANLRTTWKAIVRFGAPPEDVWPYDAARMDEEPDAFTYAFARDLETLSYIRLDPRGQPGHETLRTMKSFLAAGFPCVFGFSVSTSLTKEPDIPSPTIFDTLLGGQAVVAIGYNDNRRVHAHKGGLLIRNSWGPQWGDQGYGWLPYVYVEKGFASDFWTVLKPSWLASGEFGRPIMNE